jgi:predicted permease
MRMGYDTDRVLLVNRVPRGIAYQDSTQLAMRHLLMETAAALPGVESVAWLSSAPFVSTSSTSLFVPGIVSGGRLGEFTYQATTPDYFRVMGTRIIRGRGLTATDLPGMPAVAVISESMARVLWPGQDAMGQCFRMRSDTIPCTTVVGIAEDMVQGEITGTQRYHYYVAINQYTRTWGNWMGLRLRGNPETEAEGIRHALQAVMPGLSYVRVQPLSEIVRNTQRSWHLGATMFVAFGVLAVVVAAVGLYGVISYRVTQRLHELGVRAALGARQTDLLRLVVGQSLRLAVAGVVVGLLLALLASRWVEPLLFQQSGTDPVVYAAVAGLMLLVAVVASVVPARRAARVDPNTALRAEGT